MVFRTFSCCNREYSLYNPYFPNRGVTPRFALLTVPESYRNYNGSKWSNTSKSGSFPPEKALENFPIAANFTGS